MDIRSEIVHNQKNLHHFYLIEGQGSVVAPQIRETLIEVGLLEPNSSDFLSQAYETLLVEHTELVRSYASQKSSTGLYQFMVIEALAVTHEAQQALLKVFEEPSEGMHFFLILPKISEILPTVQSRARVFIHEKDTAQIVKEAKQFIKMSPKDRLTYIADLVKKHDDDDTSGSLRYHAIQFLGGLQSALHENPENLIQYKKVLEDILLMSKYLSSRGASVKMILEHVALVL